MASESTKFQVNFRTSKGSLVNIYAETVVDAIAVMNEMSAAVDLIETIENRFNQGAAPAPSNVAQFPTLPPVYTPEGAIAPPSTPGNDAGRTCRHGAMTYREGMGKQSGKPYRAYFCPSQNRADQCDAQFLR
jgi:hypothetical protein